jgi:branched-chain amino acid transport system ATP-binding protein
MLGLMAYALETRGVVRDFGGFRAVNGVDVGLDAGRVHALVGPNGAGKTTLFNLLTGFLRPSAGTILLFDEDVTGLPPDRIAQRGVARSFQITSLFEPLSVLEHVILALQSRSALGLRFWSSGRALDRFEPQARALLTEVDLAGHASRRVSSLPYGQKRALELALALALEPRLLLLDEPTSGMALEDVRRTIALIRRIRAGRTVVLVEHNMGVVAELADRVIVMHQGRIVADGAYETVRHDAAVIAAYLGQTDA